MKKQINSVSNLSVKGIFTLIVLITTLCSLGVRGNNKPSLVLNTDAEEMESENRIESWMNTNSFWIGSSDVDEEAEIESDNSVEQWMVSDSFLFVGKQFPDEAETVNEIQSWMNSSSYWSDFETSDNMDVTDMIGSWMSSKSYWSKGKNYHRPGIIHSEK